MLKLTICKSMAREGLCEECFDYIRFFLCCGLGSRLKIYLIKIVRDLLQFAIICFIGLPSDNDRQMKRRRWNKVFGYVNLHRCISK